MGERSWRSYFRNPWLIWHDLKWAAWHVKRRMGRRLCHLIGHAKPVVIVRPGHLMNVDWTFGPETMVAEYRCSRCDQWLDTKAAPR